MHLAFGSGECLTKTRVSEPTRHGRPRTAGGLSGFLLRVTGGEGVDEAAVTGRECDRLRHRDAPFLGHWWPVSRPRRGRARTAPLSITAKRKRSWGWADASPSPSRTRSLRRRISRSCSGVNSGGAGTFGPV